jgi:hypothetical protein
VPGRAAGPVKGYHAVVIAGYESPTPLQHEPLQWKVIVTFGTLAIDFDAIVNEQPTNIGCDDVAVQKLVSSNCSQ